MFCIIPFIENFRKCKTIRTESRSDITCGQGQGKNRSVGPVQGQQGTRRLFKVRELLYILM